jgi:hypothetical protein
MTGGHVYLLLFSQPAKQVGHLDSGYRGIVAFVSALAARAIDGLLDGISGKHSERDRHSGFERHCRQPIGRLRGYVVKMRRLTANHGAQSDDCIVAFLRSQRFCHQRKFPGAWYFHNLDVVWIRSRAFQGIGRAGQQAIGDEAVEFRANDRKLQPARVEISFDHLRHMG